MMAITLGRKTTSIVIGIMIVLFSSHAFQIAPDALADDLFIEKSAPVNGKKNQYKNTIEKYFNAYIKADLDTLLKSLHPDGPMYPKPAAIASLRNTTNGNSLPGKAIVKNLEIIEESSDQARVKVTLFIRVDINKDGNFREETSQPVCELRKKDETWRLFSAK